MTTQKAAMGASVDCLAHHCDLCTQVVLHWSTALGIRCSIPGKSKDFSAVQAKCIYGYKTAWGKEKRDPG